MPCLFGDNFNKITKKANLLYCRTYLVQPVFLAALQILFSALVANGRFRWVTSTLAVIARMNRAEICRYFGASNLRPNRSCRESEKISRRVQERNATAGLTRAWALHRPWQLALLVRSMSNTCETRTLSSTARVHAG